MNQLRVIMCGAALACWIGQAEAASFPKAEDFKPVGAPPEAAAESGPDRHEPPAASDPAFGLDTARAGHGNAVEIGHGADPGDGDHGGHSYHRNHFAVFGGATLQESEADPTAGLDYELRLSQKLGVLALAEVVFAHESIQIYGLGLGWHLTDPLRLALIPALEVSHGHMAFLTRANVEYGFHLGSLSIGPSASLDFVSGHILLCLGVAVGSGF